MRSLYKDLLQDLIIKQVLHKDFMSQVVTIFEVLCLQLLVCIHGSVLYLAKNELEVIHASYFELE